MRRGEEPGAPLTSRQLHCPSKPETPLMAVTPALRSMSTVLRTRAPNSLRSQVLPAPGPTPSPPHRSLPPRGPAHRRASALSAYSMSWLKQPQKGQRVSNTEPNCMSSCSSHRREPTFDAILGKGSPPRPQPGLGGRRGGATRNFRSRGVCFYLFRWETRLSSCSSGPKMF